MDIDPNFLRDGLITFILLVASIAFHEWGHAIAADMLGDDTPMADGRVTLNPMAHIDMFGTIIIPILNIFVFGGGLPFIGWGKPVVTNPSNHRHRWRDEILIAAAGPACNLLLALAAVVVGCLFVAAQPRFAELVRGIVVMNVGLAVFNLLPIPPLDGGSILRRIVGMSEEAYFNASRWGSLIIFLMINFSATAGMIAGMVATSCYPYAILCRLINPTACLLIFHL
jgi:Zn-dependent protease